MPLAATSPTMRMGSKIVDGGHYIFDANERAAFLQTEPGAAELLVPLIGSKEYIQGGARWILDLQDVSPHTLRQLSHVRDRISRVRVFREGSKKAKTRELAETPLQFEVNTRPNGRFLIVPKVSSERRSYVPIGWNEQKAIPSDLVQIVEDAELWHFAILTSAMHMAWLRHIGGRLKSDYRYSIGLVYNTFPWPDATPAQRTKIEALAQAVLDARAAHPASSLADLYDPDTMPPNLRKAHAALDSAVDKLYRPQPFASDRDRVEHLFGRYEALVNPLERLGIAKNRRVARKAAAD